MRPFLLRALLPAFATLLIATSTYSQGMRGSIKEASGQGLPNASIFITELNSGSSSNSNGDYTLKLAPGRYTITVSYVGFKAERFQIEVRQEWIERNIILRPQTVQLQEVAVGKRKEDFAYTIMRKAIAKRKFHLLQYNSYEMTAYIRGTGELDKVPFFLKNKIKKEGVKLDEAYTTESVSRIKFTRPNKVEEKVISVRTIGSNQAPTASPATFINQSFYSDRVAAFVSPLAGSAFAYYKFEYLGSFNEGELSIFKIRVTPRSKGDNVFQGTIYIIDDYWAIHSLDLSAYLMGFPIHMKQNYSEVAKALWMPVTHQYVFSGKALGFAGEYRYLVSCNNFKVELNPDLLTRTALIDEKVEEVPVELTVKEPGKKNSLDILNSDEPLTRKEYLKALEEYEKEQLTQNNKKPEVLSDHSFSIDKEAAKRDSAYWDSIRPLPLTLKEQQGYKRDDSLAKVEAVKQLKDSTLAARAKKAKFGPKDLLFGDRYRLSKSSTVSINPSITQFYYNTVEGFNFNLSGDLKVQLDSVRSVLLEPAVRYGTSSESLYGKAALSFLRGTSHRWSVEGGSFVQQFNPENPIHPWVNTASTLLYRRNFMKIFEKNYVNAAFQYKPSPFFQLNTSLEWARRNELFNTANYSLFYRDKRAFTPNAPLNIERSNTSFPQHGALTLAFDLSYRPIQKYRVVNGKKRAELEGSPELFLGFRKGIADVLNSEVDYDHLKVGLNHSFSVGAGSAVQFEVAGGSFLSSKSTFFMDYQHFDGNRTILTSLKPADSFRLLDYYIYSTNKLYVSAHTYYKARKLLLTRIPEIRFMGLKENLFVSYLKTSSSPHYYEVGYALDNVFRVFRIEAAASFRDRDFNELGLRIGIATLFQFKN
ncbi:DUF5686 family protein [Pedobacter sp. SYSU D00535]|uniref:DUF5686 family protein n=1 Tax=Pedobacter sp. SYSU D00535 TaxID=2810308 RepID=UPI001A957496|nr:DUF5686 family protein [Pedobacter sp. SYSU D00535]